jgi:hypothetical protein
MPAPAAIISKSTASMNRKRRRDAAPLSSRESAVGVMLGFD